MEADLQRLVDIGAQENDTLDFKRDMYGAGDEEKREMLRDIVALANHRGGHIVVGMEQDEDGIAKQLVGTEKGNHVDRITSSCLTSIERRLNGLEVEDVELHDGKVALVIKVPASFSGPHMVTFKGLNQFWVRHGRQKAPMTVDQIGEAFDRAAQGVRLFESFITARKRRLKGAVGTATWMLLTTTPVSMRQEVVDVRDPAIKSILDERPIHPICQSELFVCRQAVPSLQGLRAEGKQSGELFDYIELHRNGHLEFATCRPWRREWTPPFIHARLTVCYMDRFLEIASALWQHLNLLVPLALSMTILNAHGLWLALGSELDPFEDMKKRPFTDEPNLELPPMYAEEIVRDRGIVLKTAADRLWNAFALEECTLLNQQGAWV
jgi:hypothetical protein